MAVKKAGTSFVCYLLDFGNMVTISQNNMRPLPKEFLTKPPCAIQVNDSSKKSLSLHVRSHAIFFTRARFSLMALILFKGLFGWLWA